ncbi:MAG: thiamine ABC transporter substrate-binding protein [Anaerolineae bacterium]|nr:thiamine ABC transporter substrate-binding protein [Anaerolineae bacterium]
MRRKYVWWVCILLVAFAATGPLNALQQPVELTLITHDSFSVSEEVLSSFEQEAGIRVRILRAGDTGTMINQAILSRNNPLADVLYGLDNTFLTRALDADLFVPYESPLLKDVAEEFILDSQHRVTPIDYGDVCLNYDKAYFAEHDLLLPASFEDLTKPEYRGLLVVENPATSSPGLAFLLATIGYFGTGNEEEEIQPYTYLDFWADLVANDVLVVDSWSDAYYGEFSATGDGTRPLVVSYASSPPAEVYFAEEELEDAPTGSITASGMCFRQIEFAGILAGTQRIEAAQRFIDFLLSRPFQEDMPLQMFVFPVNREAELPEVFARYAAIPEEPAYLDSETIAAYREEWIEAWTSVVLR